MRRLMMLVAGIGLLTMTSVAAAVPPEHDVEVIDEAFTIPAGGLCDFPIEVQMTGRVLVTVHFNPDGSIDFVSQRPNIRTTITNLTNGRTATDRDVGLDKEVVNPDGSSEVLSTGIHVRIKAPDGGIVFRRIGLQIINIDASGEVTSIDVIGGNFDPFEEFADALCPALR
jgi:hypothetical protein